ncbi:hypothetical protein [Granulicella aggregans]|uniref:hypothetical protein n=1 Tax=Granulicella aggregans TaxID=474949 RepID=UPI0021DF7C3E|nr:hypothetical protein [Granulicella aggregans]
MFFETKPFRVPLFQRSKIISDDGWSVTFLGRDSAVYEEDGRTIEFGIDVGGGFLTIFHSGLRWDELKGTPLLPDEDMRITFNLMDAFQWRGFVVDIAT